MGWARTESTWWAAFKQRVIPFWVLGDALGLARVGLLVCRWSAWPCAVRFFLLRGHFWERDWAMVSIKSQLSVLVLVPVTLHSVVAEGRELKETWLVYISFSQRPWTQKYRNGQNFQDYLPLCFWCCFNPKGKFAFVKTVVYPKWTRAMGRSAVGSSACPKYTLFNSKKKEPRKH